MNYYVDVLKNYAVFSGRARRKEYWMFVLFNAIVSLVLILLGSLLHFTFLETIYSLAVLIPSLAVAFRRLHDTGRSGWWILICLIPLAGIIIFIVFMALDSQPGDNQYGQNPKGMSSSIQSSVPTPTSPSTPPIAPLSTIPSTPPQAPSSTIPQAPSQI